MYDSLMPYGRIIPALAGNTNYDIFAYADTEDHPRSRGEYWRLA